MKKSNARLKYLGCVLFGWMAASGIAFTKNPFLADLLFYLFMVLAFFIAFIRCENCETLIYRGDSKEHGMPNITSLFPSKKCPVCDIERF